MPREFELLRERLLRAGVERVHASRYIAELADHLDDLRAEELKAAGLPLDARLRAIQRLGDTDTLAEAMIARREFQAWSARAPVAAYVVTPAVVLAGATACWLAALVWACTWLRHTAWAPLADWASWLRPLADAMVWFSNSLLSVALGWGLAAKALRQRAPLLWPILGLIGLAAVGAALQIDVTLPLGAERGLMLERPTATT